MELRTTCTPTPDTYLSAEHIVVVESMSSQELTASYVSLIP